MWTPIVESMQLVRRLVAPTATRAQYQHLHWSFEACVKWILPDRQARVLPEVRVMPPSARPTASETAQVVWCPPAGGALTASRSRASEPHSAERRRPQVLWH